MTEPNKHRPHPKYLPSGIEWLGDIPEHWQIKPLKYLVRFFSGGTPSKDNPEYWSGQIPWVSPKDMKSTFVLDTEDHISESAVRESAACLVGEGTLLMVVRSGILRHSIPTAMPTRPVTFNQDIKALVPKPGLAAKYLHYLIRGNQSSLLVMWRREGATVESIEHELLANFAVPLPPLEEQSAIVDFLGHETAKLDALIAKKQRLIALLKEKRAALISHIATKGLDASVPMKDSGVAWLGEIPAHWEVWKASHAFGYIGSGTTPNTSDLEFYDGDVPWVTTSELREGYIADTTAKLTQRALEEHSALRLYQPGTLLIAMYGATIGRLGILAVDACTNQACCALSEPKQLDTKFAFYWLWAARTSIINLSSGGGQPNINQDAVRSLRICTPPLPEQRAIADYLDSETTKLDALIAKLRIHITKVQELRTALIAAAVTGKIDVRGVVI